MIKKKLLIMEQKGTDGLVGNITKHDWGGGGLTKDLDKPPYTIYVRVSFYVSTYVHLHRIVVLT